MNHFAQSAAYRVARPALVGLLLALLGPFVAAPLALAQSTDQPATGAVADSKAAPSAAATPPVGHIVDGPTEERLGRRLRCPVCQGMSIGDSPSPMAQDMMRQVRKLHAAGQSEQDIVAYFTSRYGDWVLLDPPTYGFGLWAWLLPPLALVAGLLIVWQRTTAPEAPAAGGGDMAAAGAAEKPAPPPRAAPMQPAQSEAELLARVRERVNQ